MPLNGVAFSEFILPFFFVPTAPTCLLEEITVHFLASAALFARARKRHVLEYIRQVPPVSTFGRSIFYFSQQISSTKLFAFPIGSRFHGKNARPSTLGEGFLIGILYTMSPFDRPLLIFRPLGVCLQKLFRSFDYCCGFW